MQTDLKRIVLQNVGWIITAEDREEWRVSVKTKSTFGSYKMQRISWLTIINNPSGRIQLHTLIYLFICLLICLDSTLVRHFGSQVIDLCI